MAAMACLCALTGLRSKEKKLTPRGVILGILTDPQGVILGSRPAKYLFFFIDASALAHPYRVVGVTRMMAKILVAFMTKWRMI